MSKHRSVFLIDDDPSARNGMSRLLRTAGHDVRAFQSADEFLAALEPDATGCVVLDARMPGLSGEELQKELETRGVGLSLIFVTADDDPDTRKKAMALGAAGFFRKPVDGTALLDAIEWALSKGGAK
jgi:FixJ family two-component response regulator